MSTLNPATSQNEERAHWGGIFAMTLCIFVLIASEFMPVSLLTPLARDLGVTEGGSLARGSPSPARWRF
jgi:predicted MFS family arabinose efflux permease